MKHPDITKDLCCMDERTGEQTFIRVDDAIRQGVGLARPVAEVETLGLVDATGRILADDLYASFALPPFDNSAMDGYAIRTMVLAGPGPWTLKVAGRVAAGDNAEITGAVGPGDTFRIFTGAGLPRFADAVIMQEHVERAGDTITIQEAASKADVIVPTGGVSVGEEDHMAAQLRAAGGKIEVLKIAMKPGKSLSMGQHDNAVFIDLPGNPVAAFATWKIIGAEVVAAAAGLSAKSPSGTIVRAAENSTRSPGRQEFRPARTVGVSESGRPEVKFLDNSFSAKISLICKPDGFAVIPAETRHVRHGDQMDFVYR